jgi:tyrosine-specific transport protein
MNKFQQLIGGILLVAGTTIGAGMLALPIVTGFAGFWPSVALLIGFWLYMTFTAFLLLEVNLWMGENTNLISMVKQTLGYSAKVLSWVIYLFLLYSLTTAYLAGSGRILLQGVTAATGWDLPAWTGSCFLLLFGIFVYHGVRPVDYMNRILMIGLIVSYVLIVLFLTPYVDFSLLQNEHWPSVWIGLSVISTSFGFHIIIPTLSDYLQRDAKAIRKVILIGSIIPLIVYLSWEFLTLGVVPLQGQHGLAEGYRTGLDGASLLGSYLKTGKLSFLVRCFSLFAIITSFLGVSLSLRDFLSDGLQIEKTPKGRLILYLLTFIPPLLITLVDPRAFLNALEYAGAFGVITLLGLFPVLMVWRGRYVQHRKSEYRTPGGMWSLGVALVISLFIIALEIANKIGILQVAFSH